tara:strand:- start:607 stop:1329 length:723 start_codon:yes stop_codon:yes gene_type:complete
VIEQFNFIYCLAGKGKRFTTQNITLPKYLLKLESGETILERSLTEFHFSNEVNIFIVINEAHKDFVGEIEKELSKFNNFHQIISTPDTKGQAETGFIGCNMITNDYPIFFFNGDTILKSRDISLMSNDLKQNYTGAIDAFIEDKDHFSFIKLTEEDYVVEIAEKKVISKFATTGLYGFSSKEIYTKYYRELKTKNEMYISDIYKLMLSHNEQIKGYVYKNTLDTIILGTPEEYFSNKNKV